MKFARQREQQVTPSDAVPPPALTRRVPSPFPQGAKLPVPTRCLSTGPPLDVLRSPRVPLLAPGPHQAGRGRGPGAPGPAEQLRRRARAGGWRPQLRGAGALPGERSGRLCPGRVGRRERGKEGAGAGPLPGKAEAAPGGAGTDPPRSPAPRGRPRRGSRDSRGRGGRSRSLRPPLIQSRARAAPPPPRAPPSQPRHPGDAPAPSGRAASCPALTSLRSGPAPAPAPLYPRSGCGHTWPPEGPGPGHGCAGLPAPRSACAHRGREGLSRLFGPPGNCEKKALDFNRVGLLHTWQ